MANDAFHSPIEGHTNLTKVENCSCIFFGDRFRLSNYMHIWMDVFHYYYNIFGSGILFNLPKIGLNAVQSFREYDIRTRRLAHTRTERKFTAKLVCIVSA